MSADDDLPLNEYKCTGACDMPEHDGPCCNHSDPGRCLCKSAGDLPPCPLCGATDLEVRGRAPNRSIACPRGKCEMGAYWYLEATWRRLARPPLDPRIVAVLKEAHDVLTLRAEEMEARGDGPFYTVAVVRRIEALLAGLGEK